MPKLVWSDQFSIGIDIIDHQHKRIVDYINRLEDLTSGEVEHHELNELIHALVDYTVSHFGFEELLQQRSGYPFLGAHKLVHDLFIRRVTELHQRFNNKEDVVDEMSRMLISWLVTHIKGDDVDYAEHVRNYLGSLPDSARQSLLPN